MRLELNPQIRSANKSIVEKYGSFLTIFILVLSVACVTVVTLMYSTKQVTKGYVINSLESENQLLVREMEVLDMKLNDERSLQNISSSSKISKMVNPSVVVYVKAESSIASR
jgi:hypothetical protein